MQEEEVELTPLLPKHLLWAAQTSPEGAHRQHQPFAGQNVLVSSSIGQNSQSGRARKGNCFRLAKEPELRIKEGIKEG